MAVWVFRLLPWALFVPSIFWAVPQIDGGLCFVLGIANGGFAAFCGAVASELRKQVAE